MKNTTRRLTKGLLIATTAVAMGGAATYVLASPHAGMEGKGCHSMQGHGSSHGQKPETMGQRMAEQQNRLKEALQLTPAQESAWAQFIATMKPGSQGMGAVDRNEWSQLSTPERMEKMQPLHNARQARMNERLEAVKRFYAVLTPEQQKIFDQQHMGGHQHGGHKGHGSDRHAHRNS